MPTRARATDKTFAITLAARNGHSESHIQVVGKYMTVNHRGDLLICDKDPMGYGNPVATFAFRSGSWVACASADLRLNG